jgi:hypothetical protein
VPSIVDRCNQNHTQKTHAFLERLVTCVTSSLWFSVLPMGVLHTRVGARESKKETHAPLPMAMRSPRHDTVPTLSSAGPGRGLFSVISRATTENRGREGERGREGRMEGLREGG